MRRCFKKIYAYLENNAGDDTLAHGKFFFNSRTQTREDLKRILFQLFPTLPFRNHVIMGKNHDGVNVVVGTDREFFSYFKNNRSSNYLTIIVRLSSGHFLSEDVVLSATMKYPESGGKNFRVGPKGFSSLREFEKSVRRAFPNLTNYPGFTVTWQNSENQTISIDSDDALSVFVTHGHGIRYVHVYPSSNDGKPFGYSFEASLHYPKKDTRKFFLNQEDAGSFAQLQKQLLKLFPALTHSADYEITWRMLDGRRVAVGTDEELVRYLQEDQGDKYLDVRLNCFRHPEIEEGNDDISAIPPAACSTPLGLAQKGTRSFDKKIGRLVAAGFHNKENWLKNLYSKNGYSFKETFNAISDICMQMGPVYKKRKLV